MRKQAKASYRRARRSVPEARPAPDAPEHVKATWWRQHAVALSREKLATVTGYSVHSIKRFESGLEKSARRWQQYRMACAAVEAGLEFDWLTGARVGVRHP